MQPTHHSATAVERPEHSGGCGPRLPQVGASRARANELRGGRDQEHHIDARLLGGLHRSGVTIKQRQTVRTSITFPRAHVASGPQTRGDCWQPVTPSHQVSTHCDRCQLRNNAMHLTELVLLHSSEELHLIRAAVAHRASTAKIRLQAAIARIASEPKSL
jgi:hypothetical protein